MYKNGVQNDRKKFEIPADLLLYLRTKKSRAGKLKLTCRFWISLLHFLLNFLVRYKKRVGISKVFLSFSTLFLYFLPIIVPPHSRFLASWSLKNVVAPFWSETAVLENISTFHWHLLYASFKAVMPKNIKKWNISIKKVKYVLILICYVCGIHKSNFGDRLSLTRLRMANFKIWFVDFTDLAE